MEEIKKNVVAYLTKQVEIFEQLELLNALSETEQKIKLGKLRHLMSMAHPYGDKNKLKQILFSEPMLEAFVQMVTLSIELWKSENLTVKVTDPVLFIEKMTISVLNGIFNPSLRGAVQYV